MEENEAPREEESQEENNQERVLRIRLRTECPCGSGKAYVDCCRDYHTGKRAPETAEQLMRSRYTAYFFRLADYLVGTQHPDTRPRGIREELEQTMPDMMWRSLKILSTSKGQKADNKGKVEFVATLHHEGKLLQHHEKSRFKKLKGKWKYLDAKG
ncbi:SEC-C motif-containing protein [Rubritalea squalenifaciens DSM 18772]|uniref:UPF0225 protein SAMN02745181_3375 n=1 Tax=Rubritalea squalenifaciens DSM 18772 TaxID=1123071 RepID=A0A1M6QEF1_9BACT|nr:YchJ family metal-binding protein [Rubritalea squalenifaciens]SHK18639.1 SEC-C motif-containing protein [Rubritalea squalenifaciens DSM 18772]